MSGSYFETPFGRIELTFSSDTSRAFGQPDASSPLRGGAQLHVWHSAEFRAELLVVDLEPDLPDGMAVSRCQGAFWRIHAHTDISRCAFQARWATDANPPEGGASSGQALNALTWTDTTTELCLGAPDALALTSYGNAGVLLPVSWLALLAVDDVEGVNIEDYFADGLRLRLPGLRAGEIAPMHFAVAWSGVEQEEDSAWYAVDLGIADIRESFDRMTSER